MLLKRNNKKDKFILNYLIELNINFIKSIILYK